MKEIKRQEDKKMEGSTGKTVEVRGLMKPPPLPVWVQRSAQTS
jgi:hypothetical protein